MKRNFTAILVAISVSLPAVALGQPTVNRAYPSPHRVDAARNADIVVDFSQSIDPATVGSATFRVFGRWSGVATGTFVLGSYNKRVSFNPDADFFAGEYVTVTVSEGVTNLQGVPLAEGYAWAFWARADPGTLDQTFVKTIPTRENNEGWIQSYGAYAGDLNEDGWSDLTIPNERPNDIRCFLNDGSGDFGTFEIFGLPGAVRPSPNEGADINNDGHIDLVIGGPGSNRVDVLMGDGTGSWLSDTSYVAGPTVRGVTVLDLDGDGWDDVVNTSYGDNNIYIFRNDGTGVLVNTIAKDAGVHREWGIAAADANNDGIMDVFVGARDGEQMAVLLGDGNGDLILSDVVSAGGRSWQIAVGDIDGDTFVDVVSANWISNNLGVMYGDGMGNLTEAVTYPTGRTPLAIDLGDIDGDGDLDVVTSNYDGVNWTMYENVGGTFGNKRSYPAAAAGSCVILHDRDNDGDVDLTTIDELDDLIFIWDNDPPLPSSAGRPAASQVRLYQNHPNPFNPATAIRFSLPSAAHVNLVVYDANGSFIASLADRSFEQGAHEVRWNGSGVVSGIYFYRLETDGQILSRKMVLLK